jgi:predicted nucleic-acid-binding Zn-ribbon protein
MMTPEKITPSCRYGHGELRQIVPGKGFIEWAMLAQDQTTAFLFEVYICPTCGYSELFDSDPGKTFQGSDHDNS